jgi:alpha 1,3-glucosidase
VHNVYGYFYQKVTYEALKHRYNNTQRPFVLTRSYYAGSQQYGFIWTGDNQATYQFMNNSIETNIINGLCGHSSCGSDVGGFIGDPSKDLMKHWYELGSFYLFFRGHSAFNTIRREPWLFGDDTCNSIKQSIIFRYNILLYVYTAFYNYTQNGVSILKPMWLVFRNYFDKLIDINDQSSMFVFGNELIGVNYLSLCETGCTVLNDIAKEYCLYDIHSGNVIKKFVISEGKGIDKVVIGGSVIPFSYQVKKSSFDVMRSPLSLKVFVDKAGKASGMVYYDDGVSLENNNAFIKLKVCYDNGRLNIVNENVNYDGSLDDMIPCWDKIEIYGVNKEGNKVINMLDKKMKIDKELNMVC